MCHRPSKKAKVSASPKKEKKAKPSKKAAAKKPKASSASPPAKKAKKAPPAAAAAAAPSSSAGDGEGARRSSGRARKAVSYTHDEYDEDEDCLETDDRYSVVFERPTSDATRHLQVRRGRRLPRDRRGGGDGGGRRGGS